MALPGMAGTVPAVTEFYSLPPRPPSVHPEWQGSISDKWMDRNTGHHQSRKVVETCCRNGDLGSLTRMGIAEYFTDTSAAGAQNEGRRQIIQPMSDTHVWLGTSRATIPGSLL